MLIIIKMDIGNDVKNMSAMPIYSFISYLNC
nr:MAG TPA: hypothetical protein [Caudoviricetes sp.]